eukprot:m.353312 g.353312  ORF g.353312 m.353312 type:complete len:59 (-) comp16733_c0_seq1:362-538(-)
MFPFFSVVRVVRAVRFVLHVRLTLTHTQPPSFTTHPPLEQPVTVLVFHSCSSLGCVCF